MNSENLYEVLGADPESNLLQLKQKFKLRILEVHPDKGGDSLQADKVLKAWKTLSDPNKRLEYDKWLQNSTKLRRAVEQRYSWQVMKEEGEVECPQCGEFSEVEDWMEKEETIECMGCSSFITLG